jgi:hypothetical protein
MESDKKIDSIDTQGQASAVPKSNSRRRLLQAGIGASPVVLSIVSQPVRAALAPGGVCRSASSFASFNANTTNTALSSNPVGTCAGIGPASWKSLSETAWTGAPGALAIRSNLFVSTGTSYSVTNTAVTPNVVIASPTIFEVVKYGTGTSDRDVLARNIAASYLNLAGGLVPTTVILSATQLASMWFAAQSPGGTYAVSAGLNWNAAQLNVWLQSTFN